MVGGGTTEVGDGGWWQVVDGVEKRRGRMFYKNGLWCDFK